MTATLTARTATTFTTREAWLTAAVEALAIRVFEDIKVPVVRVSVGWPGGRGSKAGVIGQCWATACAEDGVSQLFISPVMGEAVDVLAVLVHEMVHAVDDCQSGHRGNFAKIAKSLGLEGKMTATTAGFDLTVTLTEIAAEIGDYPHAVLTPGAGKKTQGTRMIKLVCQDDGYTLRTTAKWIAVGLPTCPCGEEMEVVA